MTKEEARNVFGGSIVNNLLSLGAEPTNVVRQEVQKSKNICRQTVEGYA